MSSLVVETGTGITGANSYASVLTATTYHTDRGNTAWTDVGDDDLYAAALIRASQALDGIYRGQWRPGSVRALSTQGLEWPRAYAWDSEGLPLTGVMPELLAATCEAALVELVSPGALSVALERGGMLVSKTTGPLSKTWAPGAPAGTVYPAIRQPLGRLLRRGGQAVRG